MVINVYFSACYGIVTVPTGAWFCRKCESQERAARVLSNNIFKFSLHYTKFQNNLQRCELCPSKDGALKRTDSGGWAHVVCALYIPEVRFGNVTTMEPIMLQLIPQERFNKSCYLCEEAQRGSKATIGACMQCNRAGCKNHFHVTCAQAMGLLCEEAGNYLDNVKYCGYCQYHYNKLRQFSQSFLQKIEDTLRSNMHVLMFIVLDIRLTFIFSYPLNPNMHITLFALQ
ncbi:Protein AF-10, partial [Armadillidium nasatum]